MTFENHLAAESGIIDRLTNSVELAAAGLVKVGSWSDLENAGVGAAATPAALVVYRGEQPGEDGPSAAMAEQTWEIVLVVRAPATQLTHAAAREQAGVLQEGIIKTLQGWSPERCGRMTYRGTETRYGAGGEAYFRMGFSVKRPVVSR